VLFINGNNDIIMWVPQESFLYHRPVLIFCRNTPGQMSMLDHQPWKGQEEYRSLDYRAWHYRDGEINADVDGWNVKRGGFWKGNEKLSFFAVDDAGHLSAHHQPEAVGAIVRAWLRHY
jgi:carboxypeptidase C (cathepsin A)